MGQDIHAYVEVISHFTDMLGVRRAEPSLWARLKIDRNYLLFTILGAGRGGPWESAVTTRGVPERMSWRLSEEYYLFVDDERAKEQAARERYRDEPSYCSEEDAKVYGKIINLPEPIGRRVVAHPDYHSATYLDIDEVEVAQAAYSVARVRDLLPAKIDPTMSEAECIEAFMNAAEWYEGPAGPSLDLAAVLGLMRGLTGSTATSMTVQTARFVFWFDN